MSSRPRLKGLDEMSRPRRTLRQFYFAARSRVRTSRWLAGLWFLVKCGMVLALLWVIAQRMGWSVAR